MREWIYINGGATLTLDEERCIGCGLCQSVCPHAVFGMNHRHAEIRRRAHCMECGACARNCPVEAIAVQAGVGCAAAVINTALGRKGDACCCILEPGQGASPACPSENRSGKNTCC